MLVHLCSLPEMVRQLKEPVVCLEQGDLRLHKRVDASETQVPVGFVRLSPPVEKTIQTMMTIAERVPSPSTASPAADLVPAPSVADAKGQTLATA